ncbi:MAG TPA: tetratricopeptide repeat protein [Candidatus Xenobia bacterium]|nr:tetratricopeptide repeat protein [Candidatus Xenobia bacterium]
MARLHRQELKHDEFIDTFDELLLYLEDNWRTLTTLALSVVLAGGGLGGFYFYSQRQEARAQAALSNALLTFQAPVRTGLPPLPGDTSRSFPNEKEKWDAAIKEFAAVRSDYPRTDAAQMAKHYEALSRYEAGQTDEAIKELEELSRGADRNVAALAKFHLAGMYEAKGRSADGEKLYRELAEQPTQTVPRELSQLALADLLAQSKPDEARQLYEKLKADFSGTPVADEVSRRLDLLPPAAAPVPATP